MNIHVHVGTYISIIASYHRCVVMFMYMYIMFSCFLSLSRSLGTSAMKLGKKNKDIDSFVKKIESEGQSECVASLLDY